MVHYAKIGCFLHTCISNFVMDSKVNTHWKQKLLQKRYDLGHTVPSNQAHKHETYDSTLVQKKDDPTLQE